MSNGRPLQNLAQVRQQLVSLCGKERFAAAHVYLVGSGFGADQFPGLWEFLSRRSVSANEEVIGHEARQALWEAGVRSPDIALNEAKYFLDLSDWDSAEFILTEVYGEAPTDREAHYLLAQCSLRRAVAEAGTGKLRTNQEQALRVDGKFDPQTPDEAIVLIDLLRFSGALDRASERNLAAHQKFKNDPRFELRTARIQEQLRDPAAAKRTWEQIAARYRDQRVEALFKVYQLSQQLDLKSDMARSAAELILCDLSLLQRMRLALMTRQREMVGALCRHLGQGVIESGELSYDDGRAVTDMLMNHGYIGFVVWLRRQGVPVSEETKRLLALVGFGLGGHRGLPDTLAEARALQSPEFMLPLDEFLGRAPKPAGWPGTKTSVDQLLLVNSGLGGGGAERQFVELVKALIAFGLPADQIHCAFFSLEEDRGFAKFLPDLLALDVGIHDLRSRKVANDTLSTAHSSVIETLPAELQEDVRGLWHLVQEIEPDILHGWQDRAGLAAAIVGDLARTERVVFSTRNLAPDTRQDLRLMSMSALYRDFISRSNAVLTANAEVGSNDYARWLDIEASEIPQLKNALDTTRFNPETVRRTSKWRPGDTITIGGVFRLAANKRPLLWLETIAELTIIHDFEVIPKLYGSGPMKQEILDRAEALGIANLEVISDATEPKEIYGTMDILLLMSRVEGVPNVLLEGQACGIPTAACDVGGVREALMLRGSTSGLLLAADTTAKQAAAELKGWIPDILSKKSEARVKFVKKSFSPDAFAKTAMNLYLTGGRSRG